jgi:hypothetical protein
MCSGKAKLICSIPKRIMMQDTILMSYAQQDLFICIGGQGSLP